MTRRLSLTAVLAAALAVGAVAGPALARSDAPAYGKRCQNQSKKRVGGAKGTPLHQCVTAMARLVRAETRSPRIACRSLSKKQVAGVKRTPFAKCVAAGAALLRIGNGIDRAFLADMIPHHEAAVEMAALALTRGESAFVRDLAADIIRSQNREISTMRGIASRLVAAGVKPRSLGLTRAEMGMDHDVSHLHMAGPFDLAFIDMMIPHHEGALRMSRIQLLRGTSVQATSLAKQIIASQSREIRAMSQYRAQTYGTAGPYTDHPH